MTTTGPATGQKVDSVWIDAVTQLVNDLAPFQAASSTYTPAWTSSGTAVALGNGTISGNYIQIGKWVKVKVVVTMGSTTTFGSGVYRLTLPVAPVAIDAIIPIFCFDSSAVLGWAGATRITTAAATGDNMRMAGQDGVAFVGPANPFTWASGDKLIMEGWYETA